ncbi:small ribosomal subunit Rsm22 family protein [Haloprofundus salilacus]|uniref:small ribosomal subunit Rsm22 family protein n=1 Tax=Haloprofundus salilacus TaxID=2876190 RepID=UPI001CCF1483|nr:class I SAM-dependent methyltransferase [Haloprofundus salilacus]
MTEREAVVSNAKYLRNVRPIDPEEIAEYVEGYPHPAVVKQTLREEAFDLGLVEQDNGTFVPVDNAPVPARDWRPKAIPESYSFAVEDLLVERYGANWHTGASGDELREAVRRLKEDYYYQNDVEYDETAALGYAVYHLADYYAEVGYVLADLAENGLLPRKLRVVDVGAGVGGPALGMHDYLPDDSLVDYHALEPSPAANVLDRLLGETRENFRTTIHRETAEAFDVDALGEADLVLFGNVLSELDDPVSVVRRYLDALADDGSVVALAPADRNTSIGLREVERAVESETGATVYSPTLRLWPGMTPSDRGWSFDVRPNVEMPAFQRRLDEGGEGDGTFAKTSVQFSYSVLRKDRKRRVDLRADRSRHARMADMENHVTDRIDLLAVKLSQNLADGEDRNPVFKIGDGSQSVDHYAVLTRESTLNRELSEAEYGAILGFENVLCLWNDDEAAYNLVVDAETVVEIVAP